ncbi:MAG: ABC transporter permease [Propionibacteriaceae bacterium]|nr:ABC transporter permease [Propionibacteriaceae bacterium]
MDAPLDRLGNKRFVLPIVGIIGVFCVLALVLYPMLHAAPKDVPFAIVNLDEGVPTREGMSGVGDSVVSAMTSTPSPIAWTQVDDQAALDQAMDNNDYYGAIILPATLTQDQLAASSGGAPAPHIQLIINQGKNATLASAMQSSLTAALQQKGLTVDVTVIHAVDIGGGALGSLLLILPALIMMPVVSIMIFFILRPPRGAPRQVRAITYIKQLVSTVVMSALVAGAVILMATWVGSLTISAGTLFLFLWLAAFCVMTLFLGALDIAAPLGGLVIFVIFACGLSSAVLAPEMLPSFWRTWFYPWVPQHFIGGGVSSIVSMGDGMWNGSSGPLAITAGVGIVLMLVAVAIGSRGRKPQLTPPPDEKPDASDTSDAPNQAEKPDQDPETTNK